MGWLEGVAHRAAGRVGVALAYPQERVEVLAYGFFGLFQTALLLLAVGALGALSGCPLEALTALAGGSLLRRLCGGAHASSPLLCGAVSTLSCWGMALLSGWALSLSRPLWLAGAAALSLLSILAISLWAPVDHPNKRLRDAQLRAAFRRRGVALASLLAALSLAGGLAGGRWRSCGGALCLAIFWQAAALTPAAVRLTKRRQGPLCRQGKEVT
ncbi:accessory gene regulator ArgB-like protein [Bittarella massiliensis (ex Durand et al. 2017)]|uniref:accessory gene regulator ArgB-like protein n=1 Tax=Bittarella massiliensis (ex Durand et al. 2017) TaxID=1720313 RepID=UPI001AA1CF44|nr:accessory gene regulator B family protein [Bittarella massiliensis (ex Durand et al. 2017)]MBO1680047.1 accessory gene regulator B family protein [Bittarella massiliensis (ex Durand et al. 2017)]